MRHATWVLIILAVAACAPATAEQGQESIVNGATIEYRHGETVLEGYLATTGGTAEEPDRKRPGVLVVHAWKGIGPHERETAERLARLGYVALAADIYGKGVRPATNEEAARQAGKYRGDRPLLRARVAAGLAALRDHPSVDSARVAAIGFCFGGGTVLELARSGADVAGVVSFHGNLDTPLPASAQTMVAKVLVLHGAADPHVPTEQVRAFTAEMDAAKADWQMILYGGAVHSFSDPGAGSDPSRGAAYDELAARRSFAAMESFLQELFGK
jgi:dienelactone hydrolase